MLISVTAIVLCDERFLVFFLWTVPLPAPSDAGDSAVHAGQEEQQFEHDHHGGHHRTEHVAWRSVPFVCGWVEELAGAKQVGVQGTEEERQVSQLGLQGRKINSDECLYSYVI